MRLRVFQASKGDCLLLTSDDGKRVLVDGGMPDAYREHVAPALGRLRGAIDLLYVSHIDEDHIGGVLELLTDELNWRVFDFQREEADNGAAKRPTAARPPEIKGIWHNAFHMQLGRNTGAIEDAIAAAAAVLEGSPRGDDLEQAAYLRELATGVDTALRVSHRVRPEELNIPLNKQFGGKLAMVREGQRPTRLGSLKLTVIGPSEDNLRLLRTFWNAWLRDVKNKAKLAEIRADMEEDAKRLETGDVAGFQAAVQERALEFSDRLDTRFQMHFGISEPNLASLMLLVDEATKTVLLTGDGGSKDILEGLERAGRLEEGGGIHVSVLKVQHHGATANVTKEFCRRVTADDYVLCGNGDHGNPETKVLNRIIDSRLDPAARGSHPGADGRFKLWFNSSSEAVRTKARKTHMGEVERLVRQRARASDGRMSYRFLESTSSFEIRV